MPRGSGAQGSASHQQLNLQQVYHEAPNAEVVRPAASEVLGSQMRERATAVQATEQVGRIRQEAQTEVNRLQSEAQRIVAQAAEHVGRIQHHADERLSQMQSEAQRLVLENKLRTQQTVASTQVSAAQAVASTRVNAAQALHDQDQRLRAEFRKRECFAGGSSTTEGTT
jgi:vacuolar-type H+-ATPase subunit E/Vma4